MADFRRGAEAAQAASNFASFDKTEWFKIEDKEVAILRFITDEPDWIVVDQHQNIKTRGTPPDYKGTSWPQRMGSVCRRTKLANGQPLYPDCWIDDNVTVERNGKVQPERATARVWALAQVREEVVGDGTPETGGPANLGKRGYRDAVKEVAETDSDGKPTGNTTTQKRIVVVNQGFKNFFSALEGSAAINGTITDRDFWIKRKGTGTDTDYQIVGLDPITIEGEVLRAPHEIKDKDGKPMQDEDGKVITDPGHPQWATRYATSIDLNKLVMDRASDDYYARFFDTSKPFPQVVKKDDDTAANEAPVAPKPNNDVDPEKAESIRARVLNYKDTPSESSDDPVPVSAGVDFG